jgi:hypothetical protein
MEAYHIEHFGSVDGIVLRSSEDPRPGRKEVLMRVRASSLNYRDLMVLKGTGRGPTKIDVVPLSDGAGEVEAIGEGVTRVKIADRIAGTFHPRCCGAVSFNPHSDDAIKADIVFERVGARDVVIVGRGHADGDAARLIDRAGDRSEPHRDFKVLARERLINRQRKAIAGLVLAYLRDCPAAFRARIGDKSPFRSIALAGPSLPELRLKARRQLPEIDCHCFPSLPQSGGASVMTSASAS